ncbi:hypothetical protein OG216_47465 (plasmid) [Streptomycetaceae bacterium NBC_01309]
MEITRPDAGAAAARTPKRKRAWRATERDMAVLAWLGKWKCATADQIHAEFVRRGEQWDLAKVQRRLLALRTLKLVDYSRWYVADLPGLHWLSRDGMALVGLDGAMVVPRVDEVHHDLAVVDLAAQIAGAYPDRLVVTEREIRARETPSPSQTPDFAYSVPMESDRLRRLYPDLVTVAAGGAAETPGGAGARRTVVAHEVERTRKPVPRLVENMLAYVTAGHIDGVCYWCFGETLTYVTRAAEEANARGEDLRRGRKVSVRPWTPTRSMGVVVP